MRYKSLPMSVRAADSMAEPSHSDGHPPVRAQRRAWDRLASLAMVALLPILLLPVAPAAASPDPQTCVGYPEPRVFLETQNWWTEPGDAVEGESRHIHTATCFPWKQQLRGIVPFDIQVQLHDNPGLLTRVDVQIFGDSGGVMGASKSLSVRCAESTCVYWYHLDVDTAKYPLDGRQEFRVHAYVTAPDGTKGRTTTGWQAYLVNGKPVNDYRPSDNFTEARGWYTDFGYTNARLTTPLPTGPVSGTWSFGVKLAPGSGGDPVTSVLASVDPKFHAVPAVRGIILKEASAPFAGTLSIDTRKLANGVHKLFLRADAAGPAGTNSGAQVILFTVSN